jgi:inner membrane protein
MNPETHLLASWVIGAKTTDNARDCRLVALAGILPDADGLGIVVDGCRRLLGFPPTWYYYQTYHHYLLHGVFGAALITLVLSCFARRKGRVALLCLAVFHFHLLCDLVGSRGPDRNDLWPIFYFAPITTHPMWVWKEQWPLDAWPNRAFTLILFVWALWLPLSLGHSFVGVFNRRLDGIFVETLRKWWASLTGWWSCRRGSPGDL